LNLAFTAFYLSGKVEECLQLLVKSGRFAEAALMARTYVPSELPRLVKLWKDDLHKKGQDKVASMLADPVENEVMFPDVKYGLIAELATKSGRRKPKPSAKFQEWQSATYADLLNDVKGKYGDPNALPPVSELVQQAQAILLSKQPASPTPKVVQPTATKQTSQSPSPTRSTSSGAGSTLPPTIPKQQGMLSPNPSPRRPTTDGDEAFSDNLSYISMEVNTTGSGSLKADDMSSEMSFTSTDNMRSGVTSAPFSVSPSNASIVSSPAGLMSQQFQPAKPSALSNVMTAEEKKMDMSGRHIIDELDAALGGASLTSSSAPPASGSAAKTSTGDPDLDELLNL
jgi:coatomer subunit beta'